MKRSQGKAEVQGRGKNLPHLQAHVVALEAALEDWVEKYDESPPWDELNFRGGHTTTTVVIELMDVEVEFPAEEGEDFCIYCGERIEQPGQDCLASGQSCVSEVNS